jgi:hypothetical protein
MSRMAMGAGEGATASGLPGALIGGGLGAATGLVESNQEKKARERAETRPKRRRLQLAGNLFQEARRRKEASLGTLSQATFDWSQALR